ncbi:MAG: hypothetical protein V4737_08785 [Curtobacterium sp.]
MTPIYVVTTFNESTQETETAGGFADLVSAKALASEHRLMLTQTFPDRQYRVFIEEWHGGDFHAHRELRADPSNPKDPSAYQWFVAQGPAFAPIKEGK